MTDDPQTDQGTNGNIHYSRERSEGFLNLTTNSSLTIHEITKKLLANQLALTTENIPGIYAGIDIEAVHKTRVGFRRIRSRLRILKPLFKKKYLQPFRNNSRKIGQALGAVRDLDVLKISLSSAFQEHHPTENFHTAFWRPFFLDQYQQARTKLLEQLESRQFTEFIQSFTTFCDDIEIGAKKPEKIREKGFSTFKSYVSSMLRNQYQNVQIRQIELSAQPIDTNFHQLRIEIKRFRYTLDFFSPILKLEPTLGLINSLTNLQDHLGTINDHVSAERIISLLLEHNSQLREHNFAGFLSEYRQRISLENDSLQANFHHSWQSFQEASPKALLNDCYSELKT